MKICVISDTHSYHKYIELNCDKIDTIIHCGDFSSSRLHYKEDAIDFLNWYSNLNIKNKILIAGNHDLFLFKLYKQNKIDKFFKKKYPNIIYLQDSSIIIDGIKFYGSPWTLRYYDWYFMLNKEDDLASQFQNIDDDTNVLITHSPAEGILDYARGNILGSSALLYKIENLKDLKFHLHGHIHESYGYRDLKNYTAINAAYLNYDKENLPIIFDYYTKEFL